MPNQSRARYFRALINSTRLNRNPVQSSSIATARTVYIGPEPPLNAHAFTQVVEGNAGQVLPGLFQIESETFLSH